MVRTEDLPLGPAWISLRRFTKDATPAGSSRTLRDGLAAAYGDHAEQAVRDYGKLLLAIHPHMFLAPAISPPPAPEEMATACLLRPVMHGNTVMDVMIHPDVLEDFLRTYSPVRGAEARERRPEAAALVETWQTACRSHPHYQYLTHAPFSEQLVAAGSTTGSALPSEQWVTDTHRNLRRARRIVQRLSPRDYALSGQQEDAATGQTIQVVHPFLVCLLGYEPVFINFEGHDKVAAPYQQSHRDLLPPLATKRKPDEDSTPEDSSSLAETPQEFHAVLARESYVKKVAPPPEQRRKPYDWQNSIEQERRAVKQYRDHT